MVKRVIFATILGALIVHFFGFLSWVVLPFHQQTIKSFTDEAAVVRVINDNAATSGVYISPKYEKNKTPDASQPQIFLSVKHEGQDPTMKTQIIHYGIFNLVSAFLASLLLTYAARGSYFCRLSFMMLFGLTVGILGVVPMVIWFGFSVPFAIADIADYFVAWTLAGIIMAAIIKKPRGT